MITRIFSFIAACLLPLTTVVGAGSGPEWTDVAEADKTLMGDYVGEWIDAPKKSYQDINPRLCAQVINVDKGIYRLRFVQDLNLRAEVYFLGEAKLKGNAIVAKHDGWDIRVTPSGLVGKGNVHGKVSEFKLKRVERVSPTMGAKAPKGATVLFDGDDFDEWEHSDDGRPVTWTLLGDGAMEINPKAANKGSNPAIGGEIQTKRKFKDVRYHMEFRYPVEPGKSGQGRGNSGLFFQGYECQVLNSYGLEGLWNELGSLYKMSPPKVNAARPPMQWQTYDIVYHSPKFEGGKLQENARITVRLNGTVVQKSEELRHQTSHTQAGRSNPAPNKALSIKLQDHSNRIQFRNIWVKEL